MRNVRIGVIGCGVISNVYLSNIRKYFQTLEVVSCADAVLTKAEETAKKYGLPRAYGVDELLADASVDIVLNLTIPQAHYEITKKALLAGKHVYCEKPLALTFLEAKELKELAERQKKMLGCAPDSFLGAALSTCRKLIDEGWIGKPIQATANMMNHGPETWHPNPDFYYRSGGGPMMDMGPYYLTALVSLLGPVSKATCFTTKGFDERRIYSRPRNGQMIKTEVPTAYAGILDFESGAIANVNMSFDAWLTNLPKLEIYGTLGTLVVPDPNHFGGEIRLVRSEPLIEEIDGLTNDQAVGRLSQPKMWENFCVMPTLYRQPSDNMRGIGLWDMACALVEHRKNRAGAALACHVSEILECLQKEGEVSTLTTSCERPAPLAAGTDIRELQRGMWE